MIIVLPLSNNPNSSKLSGFHMDLDSKVNMTLFLHPQQTDFTTQEFSTIWKVQCVIESYHIVLTIVGSALFLH